MLASATNQSINANSDSTSYSKTIIYAAYITAFITISFLVFLYYHCQHLIKVKSKPLKVSLVAAIILGIKGNLIRQPIMDIILNYTTGFNNPVLFVMYNHIDIWLANILLALCLVYLCPQKLNVRAEKSF